MTTSNSVFNSDGDSRQFGMSVVFLVPLAVDVKPIIKADFPFTIDSVSVATESGSHLVAIKRKRGATTSNLFAGNITVNSTIAEYTPTGNNSFVAGDILIVSYGSVNNAIMSVVQINCTRDYTP